MNKEELIKLYKNNFKELEDVYKKEKQLKEEKEKNDLNFMINFNDLKNKVISNDEYNINYDGLKEEERKIKNDLELSTIRIKLLYDNEEIIIKKIVLYIKENILKKYINKNIGEKTIIKIDEEIKEEFKKIYDEKYINLVNNTYYNYTQFIDISNIDYSFQYDYYTKKLNFRFYSKLNHSNNKLISLYIKDDLFKFYEYDKTREETQEREEKILKSEIIKDTRKKANEILKAYKIKEEKVKKYEDLIYKEKEKFKNTIYQNEELLNNVYNYFYR